MYNKCLHCDYDLSDLMNWDTLCDEYITCPNCGTKLVVCYDETYDGIEEECYWWLEKYYENDER